MKVDVNKFLEINDKRAFRFVFEKLKHECEQKFESKINDNDNGAWLDDGNDELEGIFIDGLVSHVDRINRGGYSTDDIVDAVNFLVMIYNICEE